MIWVSRSYLMALTAISVVGMILGFIYAPNVWGVAILTISPLLLAALTALHWPKLKETKE